MTSTGRSVLFEPTTIRGMTLRESLRPVGHLGGPGRRRRAARPRTGAPLRGVRPGQGGADHQQSRLRQPRGEGRQASNSASTTTAMIPGLRSARGRGPRGRRQDRAADRPRRAVGVAGTAPAPRRVPGRRRGGAAPRPVGAADRLRAPSAGRCPWPTSPRSPRRSPRRPGGRRRPVATPSRSTPPTATC